MRSIVFYTLSLILPTLVFSQYDSVQVKTVGDTVQIWNTQIEENCAFSINFGVEISNDTITIIEHDTVTQKVTCSCLFNLCVSFYDLESGNYVVNIYRKYSAEYYNVDSLYYVGSTTFSYINSSSNLLSIQYYQSGCYSVNAIQGKFTIPANYFLLNAYPNPFNDHSNIEMYIPNSSLITLKLYDLSGRYIETLIEKRLSPGKHIYNFIGSNLASGTYIVTLETENLLKASTKIFLIK
jgi:hypothetical protein